MEAERYTALYEAYCKGNGADIGSGGVPCVPWAIQVDLPEDGFASYNSGRIPTCPIQWRGDARQLPFRDEVLDFVFSSHLIEDFNRWEPLLDEWCRVLKDGGYLIILAPEKSRWKEAIARGVPPNDAHVHEPTVGELSTYAERYHLKVLVDGLTDQSPMDYGLIFIAQKKL